MREPAQRLLATSFPGQEHRFFAPMSIGSTPAQAHQGAALIVSGTKTLTSSAHWEYPDGRIPFVGALCVLIDGAGRPRGIVETTRVEILPFSAVTEDMARHYGEGERTVAWWRHVMGRFYREAAARHHAAFGDDTMLIWEWIAAIRRF